MQPLYKPSKKVLSKLINTIRVCKHIEMVTNLMFSIVNIHSLHSFNLHRHLSVKMALVGVVILKTILLTEVDLSTLSKFQVLLWIKSSWETVCSLKVGKKIMYYFTWICRLHTKINNMAQSYMYITYDELWRNGTQRKYKKVCQLGLKPS